MMRLKKRRFIISKVYNTSFFLHLISYDYCGDTMKVKIFDEGHEKDLETAVNKFLKEQHCEVIDIKYQVAISVFSEEQVFCFSAMIIYN